MSIVTLTLSDNEDGTLRVVVQADPDAENSQAQQVSLMFLQMLENLQKPQIITGE